MKPIRIFILLQILQARFLDRLLLNVKKKILWGVPDECTVKFDPRKKGQLINKNTGEPIDVFIIEIHDNRCKKGVSFNFLSKDLEHEYGHVELDGNVSFYDKELSNDYKKEDIKGERIIVTWLENTDDKNIGGVGKLADKVAVKYCVENNIEPNIISQAADNSHLAHYSRGKRFIRPKLGTLEFYFLMLRYGTLDPNKALERLLKKSKRTGKQINLSQWNECLFYMYLPKELVEKYKNEDY